MKNKLKKSKIGILTFHDTANFGACLQAVATYKIITALGYNCEIINYHCKEIDKRETIPDCILGHSPIYPIRFWIRHHKSLRKRNKLKQFLKKETKVSYKKYRRNNIIKADRCYDKFLVGSDMLWCTRFTNSDYTYMLDFVKDDKKKYSYATSMGYLWGENEKVKALELLNKFRKISVREEDMAFELAYMLNRKIKNVCDPTMMILPDVWKKYINESEMKRKNKYCLTYVDLPNGKCIKETKVYSRKYGIDAVLIGFKKKGSNIIDYEIDEVYQIEDFLAYIYNAEFLFTSSYHGMLFAIYFHTPFVYYNKDSSRLECIAQKFGLDNRNGDKYDIDKMKEIDWEMVDKKRKEFVNSSQDYLEGIFTE